MEFIVSFLVIAIVIAVFSTLYITLELLKDGKKFQKQTGEFVKWLIIVLVSILLAFQFGIETWGMVWKMI